MKVGELFAGIGGFGLAAQRSACGVVWACEIDDFASRVYAARFPDVPIHPDVRGFGYSLGCKVDCITAGFPCQDVSVAGKRKGLVGERTGLFWEIVRIAKRLRPCWLLLENVPGLLSSHRGRDFETVLAALDELGYGVAWRVLDAQFFGVPQRRRRVFIVGHLGGPCPAEVLFEPEGVSGNFAKGGTPGQNVAYSLRASPSHSGDKGDGGLNTTLIAAPLGAHHRRDDLDNDTYVTHSLRAEGADASEDGTGRGTPITLAPTLRVGGREQGAGDSADNTPIVAACINPGHEAKHSYAGDGGTLNIVGVRPRRLTPRECERLQGFPDDWTLIDGASDSARYRALGNAVEVNTATWILRRVGAISEDQTPP